MTRALKIRVELTVESGVNWCYDSPGVVVPMVNLFFRTLSQALQAFMPPAAALIWCARMGDRRCRRAIHRSLLLSAPATVVGAWWFARSAARALDLAVLATTALVIGLASARALRSPAAAPPRSSLPRPLSSDSILLALSAATLVIVIRQTMEIGSVFAAAALQLRSLDAVTAILGAVAAASTASWLWARVGRVLPLPRLIAATRTILVVFLVKVAVDAFHYWAEAGLLPWSEVLHSATEPYGPDGVYGVHVSDGLIIGPLAVVMWWPIGTRVRVMWARLVTPIPRRRLATMMVVACLVSIGLQRTDARDRGARVEATVDFTPILAQPHLVFRDTTPGATFGRLSVAALDNLEVRVPAATTCERVSFADGRGLCLHVDRGVFHRYSAVLLDSQLKAGPSIKLQGLPSRTRVAPGGQVGAVTVFVTGDSYAADFSTRTTILDVASGDEIGELEQFGTLRNGVRFRAADFNFWGVTFAHDGNTFYATLRTAGTTSLVRGELALRRLTIVRDSVECPSLSPDGRRLAYKKRIGPSPESWRLHVLDLSTNAEHVVAGETRYVDDQVEWLDPQHVLYSIPRRTTAISDVWMAAVDSDAPARLFLAQAESPIVVR